jgi:hypothetical protein
MDVHVHEFTLRLAGAWSLPDIPRRAPTMAPATAGWSITHRVATFDTVTCQETRLTPKAQQIQEQSH